MTTVRLSTWLQHGTFLLAGFVSLVGTVARAQGTAWNLNAGNNNATSASYLGTTNAIDLSLRTVGLHRLLVSGLPATVGNVGIGSFTSAQLTGKLNVKQGWSDWMEFHTTLNTRWNFHNPSTQDAFLLSYTNSANVTTFDYFNVKANGNVGFGVGTAQMNGKVNIKQGWSDWMQFHRTLDNGYWHIHNPSPQDKIMFFFTNAGGVNQPSISFWNSGKVSIGTENTPGSYRLYVTGGILTEKVKVALLSSVDWADYVFSPGYTLMPLEDVEAFISVNGHLPGVPSADEMVEQGLDVAKTDAMLMAKVEELTLYVLQLKKELEALKNASKH
jgi:hypothetical protein